MELWQTIRETYPELTDNDFIASIILRDDGDGVQYINKWEYSKPLPEGLTLGKPGGNN